jgi:hypothetical protein
MSDAATPITLAFLRFLPLTDARAANAVLAAALAADFDAAEGVALKYLFLFALLGRGERGIGPEHQAEGRASQAADNAAPGRSRGERAC